MNILQVTGMNRPTKFGGFEKWLVALCDRAAEEGHKVYIAYSECADCVQPYSECVNAAHCELVVIENDKKLEAFCTEHLIKIVHFHFGFDCYKPVYRHLHQEKIALFAHLHCENYFYKNTAWKHNPAKYMRIMAHRLKTFYTAKFFKQIFASSEMVRKEYQSLYFWSSTKLSVLYLGISEYVPNKTHENSIPVIACIAFHSPIKGVDTLLCALKILMERKIPFHLIQMGGGSTELHGEDTQALKDVCHSLLLDGHVSWTGVTNNVQRYLEQADIYCQPSRTESLPLSIAEAMQCQLPIVACNVGGVPELVHNGTNGYLVQPENPEALASALEGLLCNRALRETMGNASKNVLKDLSFSITESINKLWEYYKPWIS